MPKTRLVIPEDTAAAVLFAADRTCCVCNLRSRPVQIHHIDEDPSNNDYSNLAVLCVECHNETQLKGGFGRRLNAPQVVRYRDNWNLRVLSRRTEADRLAATLIAEASPASATTQTSQPWPESSPELPSRSGLLPFVRRLPALRRLAYESAREGWAGGTTDMIDASYRVIELLETALSRLARYYPANHFGVEDTREYFSDVIATRFRWHGLHVSTGGLGFSGTIVGPMVTACVIADVEQMIEDMVGSLLLDPGHESFDFAAWRTEWRGAHNHDAPVNDA
jgi:hypothetical protein